MKSVLWPILNSNVVGVSLSGGSLGYWTACNNFKRHCTLPYCAYAKPTMIAKNVSTPLPLLQIHTWQHLWPRNKTAECDISLAKKQDSWMCHIQLSCFLAKDAASYGRFCVCSHPGSLHRMTTYAKPTLTVKNVATLLPCHGFLHILYNANWVFGYCVDDSLINMTMLMQVNILAICSYTCKIGFKMVQDDTFFYYFHIHWKTFHER